jgi:hypothetical protein
MSNAVGASAILLLLAGCSIGRDTPQGDEGWARLFEDRRWIEDDAALLGTVRAWMRGGQLMTMSCLEAPRFGSWRWTGETTFEWIEGERPVRAEVAMVGPEDLVLVLGADPLPQTRRFKAADTVSDPC